MAERLLLGVGIHPASEVRLSSSGTGTITMKDDAKTGGVYAETAFDDGEAGLRGRRIARVTLDGLRNATEQTDYGSKAAAPYRTKCQGQ